MENVSLEINPVVTELLSTDAFRQILFQIGFRICRVFGTKGVVVSFSDPFEIRREELSQDLSDPDFFKVTVSSAYIDQDEVYILDEKLTQNIG